MVGIPGSTFDFGAGDRPLGDDRAPSPRVGGPHVAFGAYDGAAFSAAESRGTSSVISDGDEASLDVAMSLMAADERGELEDEARVITTNVKAWIVRRNYMKVREAARVLEARSRDWIQRRSEAPKKRAASMVLDGRLPLDAVPEHTEASKPSPDFVKLQAASRGMLARRHLNQLKQQMLALLVISRNFRDRNRIETALAAAARK